MIDGYTLIMRDVGLEEEFMRESVEWERRLHTAIVTDGFRSSGKRRKRFLLVAGGGEEGGEPWSTKLLPCFRIDVMGSNEIQ